MSEYKIQGTRKKTVLCRFGTKIEPSVVVMQAITEEQEVEIDKSSEENAYKRSRFYIDDTLMVEGKEIYAYGEINLKEKDDINLIESLNIIDDEVMGCRNVIPTTFDYAKGTIKGVNPWSHTWNKLEWFKYHYCMIGKPKRIIIYKIAEKNYSRV